MGTVWVAEQTQPVRRKVALKLIKAGMDSKSVLARFEAERQALAVMDHPNIAKVLDGGLTETGRPFFVMEYVKGVPITEYCDATRLSVPERLNLFVQVCQAVQHAHQKGIIHRDLKPSNILVAPYDDKPVPKVIDFGLAKAMHQSLTERTLHTAHETVLGTPLYMSPEQAQLNNLDVDTRSDIYSLGVLLYELLTGTTPLEKQRFKEAAWDEIRRIIREEEPPRPSTRLSSSQTLPSLAAGRQTEPAQVDEAGARRTGLDRDEGAGEGPHAPLRDGQRLRDGHPALPGRRAGAGGAAQRTLPAAEVRPEAPGGLDDGRGDRPAARGGRGRQHLASGAGHAGGGCRTGCGTGCVASAADAEAEARRDRRGGKRPRPNGHRPAEAGDKLAGERLEKVEAEKKQGSEEKQIAAGGAGLPAEQAARVRPTRGAQADALLHSGATFGRRRSWTRRIRELLDRAAKELAPETIEATSPKQPLVQAEILATVGEYLSRHRRVSSRRSTS